MKKILLIDDSALMRRVLSDIISKTSEYRVSYTAANGVDGLALLEQHSDIEVVLCDIMMPQMGGLELLQCVKQKNIQVPFVMISSSEDTQDTITALELGAIEFIKKPVGLSFKEHPLFERRLLNALEISSSVRGKLKKKDGDEAEAASESDMQIVEGSGEGLKCKRKKLVALVCSTGGPKALQSVIPALPKNLAAPVLVVQHMPAGFTGTLSARLNDLSMLRVKEAEDGERLKVGCVYIAKGGTHLTVEQDKGKSKIVFDDSPPVVGLKPCGNIMYESLCNTDFDEIVCVVLTGMGADGTQGIRKLSGHNRVFVIAQDEASSTVYGMPRAIYESGLADVVCDIHQIANEIVKKVGVL